MGAITEGESMDGKAIDVDQELALQMRELEAEERRTFIREAAIQLCVAHRTRDEIWQMSHSDAKAVWDTARALWITKPEDC